MSFRLKIKFRSSCLYFKKFNQVYFKMLIYELIEEFNKQRVQFDIWTIEIYHNI